MVEKWDPDPGRKPAGTPDNIGTPSTPRNPNNPRIISWH